MYPFFIGWNKEDLEKLRLCRNRAYYKVNTKRRQHLQASLSTYLHKEWLSNYQDTGLSAKALLKVYTDYFEPDDQKVNGEVPKGAVGGRGGRGRRCRRRPYDRTEAGHVHACTASGEKCTATAARTPSSLSAASGLRVRRNLCAASTPSA